MIGSGDAGSDAGPRPGIDAGPPIGSGDAGLTSGTDAGPIPDAGAPDAGEAPCTCPAFPTACATPTADAPAFTPDAEASLGQLFDLVACASSTLRLAVYEGDWDCLSGALNLALAQNPSLTIELVVDDDRCAPGDCFADALVPAERVTVIRDMRAGLMHHKFAIADDARVWVGSANFSRRSFCQDLNNSLVIEQPTIVARYGEVFDRMFDAAGFGPVAPEGPTAGGAYTVYFSPETPASAQPAWMLDMVGAIEAATTSIEVMIFAWTRTEISDALLAASTRGVTVRTLVSPLFAGDAPAQALVAAGLEVREGPVHSKVLVIDGQTVITGSANWSMNAWSNNENSLWIRTPSVAAAYRADFEAAYAAGSPVTP